MSVTIKEKSKKDHFGTAKIRFQRFYIHKNKVDEKIGKISNLVQSSKTPCEYGHEKQARFQKRDFKSAKTLNLKLKKSCRKRRWVHSIWRLSYTAELAEAKPRSSGKIFIFVLSVCLWFNIFFLISNDIDYESAI